MCHVSLELLMVCGAVGGICATALLLGWAFDWPAGIVCLLAFGGLALFLLALAVPNLLQKRGRREADARRRTRAARPSPSPPPPAGPGRLVFRGPAGLNFRSSSDIPMDRLPAVLARVVDFLERHDPHARLLRHADWWEHDGLHYPAGEITYAALRTLVESERSIRDAMPNDEETCVGIAPDTVRWYLRFAANPDPDTDVLVGYFDLTPPDELTGAFRREVLPGLPCEIAEDPAQTYYDRLRG
jgi:hypothetical protein